MHKVIAMALCTAACGHAFLFACRAETTDQMLPAADEILLLAAEAIAMPREYFVQVETYMHYTFRSPPSAPWPQEGVRGSKESIMKYQRADGVVHIKGKEQIYKFSPDGQRYGDPSHRWLEQICELDRLIVFGIPQEAPDKAWAQIATIPAKVERARGLIRQSETTGEWLSGIIPDRSPQGSSVIDLARAGKLSPRVEHETIDGVECYVVTSEIPGGQVRLWIAPTKGYNPLKYIVRWKDIPPPRHRDLTLSVSITDFLCVDGRILPAAGQFQADWVEHRGTQYSMQITTRRTKIDLHPTFDEPGLFTPAGIPDGAQVSFQQEETDKRPIVFYVWRNGRPVLEITPEDRNTLQQIDSEIDRYEQTEKELKEKESDASACERQPRR